MTGSSNVAADRERSERFPTRRFRWITVALLALGFAAGCGGGDSGGGDAPATPAERAAVGQLRYCFEGAGALTARPGEQIPALDRTPSAPEADGAKRVLVAYWADTGDAAHIYYVSDAEAAEQVAGELSERVADELAQDGVEWSGGVIVVPDEESPPSEDEALLASDCLPPPER
jgi:hypothetical protein